MSALPPFAIKDGVVAVEDLAVSHGPVHAVKSVGFAARRGEVVTLLGPSGCGKTTMLRAIAGLERPRRGRIAIGGQVVFDAAHGLDLAPERRGLSMVFQSYAIWPHMTVFENVAFGLRARGARARDLEAQVRESLTLVGLADFADRPATRLSGGQQQRVALARSVAGEPRVVLLDEPLSNLDAQLRLTMRAEFKQLQRRLGLTAIYVTHDQEEALVLSDHILLMRDGHVEQAGMPAEIHHAPRTRFAAEFMGVCNILPCTALREGTRAIALLPGGLQLTARGDVPAGRTHLCFRPVAVRLAAEPSPDAHPAVLTDITYLGDLLQYELHAGDLSIIARGLPRGDLSPGMRVFWSVPREACFLVGE